LSTYATDPAPWLSIQANSEQRQPLYLGFTPHDLVFNGSGKPKPKIPSLPLFMKVLAEHFFSQVEIVLVKKGFVTLDTTVYLEVWPILNDIGQLTWSISRWKTPNLPWRWLNNNWFNYSNFRSLNDFSCQMSV
jgi:hypothetical protein